MKSTNSDERCQIRLDRLVVGVPQDCGLPEPKGFKVVADTRIRPRGPISTYERVRLLRSRTNSCYVSIQYKRQAPWLPAYRITLVGDDGTGITLEETKQFLVDCPEHLILLIELAFDFHPDTGVDEQFVLRHGRFGKSRRRTNRGGPGQLRYGGRGSPKLVRCYFKRKLSRYRVELELHSSLLKKHSIRNIADLSRLTSKLCPVHFSFKGMRWKELRCHLVRKHGPQKGNRLCEEAREHAQISLRRATRFLSRHVHNPHRFLGPAVTNRDIRDALKRWATEFTPKKEVYQ